MRAAEDQFRSEASLYFFCEAAVRLNGAGGAVHDEVVGAELRNFVHKSLMVQFVQTAVEKPDFMVGVSFENGRAIGQLPGVIGEYI